MSGATEHSGHNYIATFIAQGITGNASNVVQANANPGLTYASIHVVEIAGVATSSAVDVAATASSAANGTSAASSAFSTLQASEVVVAFAVTNGGTSFSSPTIGGQAATTSALDSGHDTEAAWYIFSTSQSGITANFTLSQSDAWDMSVVSLKAPGSSTNVTVNAPSAQIRLRSPAPTVTASTPATVNPPSAQLRLRSASPAVLSTSSALSGPSAQIRLRSSPPTVTTGSSATVTARSAQIRLRSAAPSVNTTSGKSIQAPSAQLRVRTGTPNVASSSSLHGTSAQIRLRSYGVTVFASAAIPEICNPTALILTSNTTSLTLTGRDTTMALTGPADTTLTVDSDDASTLTLTIC